VADARHRAEQVGARAQMCNFAQKFQRMRLGLDRIGFRVIHPAEHFDGTGLNLERLPLPLRGDQRACGDERASGRQALDLTFVVAQCRGGDNLDRCKARAIAQGDKAQARLGIAAGAHPAAYAHGAPSRALARQKLLDAGNAHVKETLMSRRRGENASLPDFTMLGTGAADAVQSRPLTCS